MKCFKLMKLDGSTTVDNNYSNYTKALENLCILGELELCKLLYEKYKNIHKLNKYNFDDIIKNVCKNGHLEVVKWLFEISKNDNIENDIDKNIRILIIFAFEYKHIELTKWLIQIAVNSNKINEIDDNIFNLFKYAYKNKDIELAKWILEIDNNASELNIEIIYILFCNVCKYKNLDLIYWVWNFCKNEDGTNKINILTIMYTIFYKCDLDYSIWLFEECVENPDSPMKINIDRYTTILYICCSTGFLDLAKRLLKLSKKKNNNNVIDVSKGDNIIFRDTCKKGHVEVIKWLCEINDNYSYKFENDEYIPIIKHPLDKLYEINNYNEMINKLNITKEITVNEEYKCLICQLHNSDLEENDRNTMIKLNCNEENEDIKHCVHIMCLYRWYIKNSNNKNCICCSKNISIKNCYIIKNYS